jgi:Na+-transporting NADH:ubiquinone oxidoreductase subunit C
MKNGYFYTIGFILVLTILLSSGLALTNSYFTPKIQENFVLAEKKAILDAFGVEVAGSPDEIASRFSESVRESNSGDLRIFQKLDAAGKVDGLAVPFNGPGLWGSIQGYLAVSADRLKILGIVFTAQNETPGLGGRIDEAAFRNQFRGLDIAPDKDLAYGAAAGGKLDAIAGATASSNAVLKIVNNLVEQTLPELEVIP